MTTNSAMLDFTITPNAAPMARACGLSRDILRASPRANIAAGITTASAP